MSPSSPDVGRLAGNAWSSSLELTPPATGTLNEELEREARERLRAWEVDQFACFGNLCFITQDQKEKQLASIRAELFSRPQAYTSTTGPAGGHRLGSGSRGLASLGFAVRPGPALPPAEDPPSQSSSQASGLRSFRPTQTSKRERELEKIKKQKKRKGTMRPPGEKLQDKVRKRRPENKEADKRRQGTAEAKRLQRERQKTDKYRAGAATRLIRSRDTAAKKAARSIAAKKAAERHAPKDKRPKTCDLRVTIDDVRKFGLTELGCQRCDRHRLHKDMKYCSYTHSKVCRERIKGKLSETPEGKVRLDRVQARLDRSRLPNRDTIPATVRGEKVNHN